MSQAVIGTYWRKHDFLQSKTSFFSETTHLEFLNGIKSHYNSGTKFSFEIDFREKILAPEINMSAIVLFSVKTFSLITIYLIGLRK